MNQDFVYTVYLFVCGARGITPNILRGIDVQSIYKISKIQGVWPTVFLALIKLYQKDKTILTEDEFQKLNNEFILQCSMQMKRVNFIHKIIYELKKSNIKCCVLKGESVSRFYKTPIARISSDTDIIVHKKDIKKTLLILKDNGFIIGDKIPGSHEIKCTHPVAGLVEIHTQIYADIANDICFNNLVQYNEKYISFETFDNYKLFTLGITDNMMFLLMHFLKHFMFSGIGIRQLGDILLYIENYYDKIDWNRVNCILDKLNYTKIFSYIIAIGEKYFMFPSNLIKCDNINNLLMEKILNDMCIGGIFGHCDTNRKDFYNLYLQARYKRFNNDAYSDYKNRKKIYRLFPNRKFMSVNYSYVNKSIALLPIAWIHRILNGLNCKIQYEPTLEQKERLDFLNELEMI